MNLFQLKGKTAIITGASRDIRRSLAGGFALAGADIVLVCRNLSALKEAAMSICQLTYEIPQKENRN